MGIKVKFPFEYTRFEKARIIGARALQIAMGAPVLIDTDKTEPIEIASKIQQGRNSDYRQEEKK